MPVDLIQSSVLSKKSLLIFLISVLAISAFWLRIDQELSFAANRVGIEITLRDQHPLIVKVLPKSPAERAGIPEHSLILALDGVAVGSLSDLDPMLQSTARQLSLTLRHNEQTRVYHLQKGMPPNFSVVLQELLFSSLFFILAALSLPSTGALPSRPNQLLTLLLLAMGLDALLLQIQLPILSDAWLKQSLVYFMIVLAAFMSAVKLALEVHLLTLLPKPPPWLQRHRKRLLAATYALSAYLFIILTLQYLDWPNNRILLRLQQHWSIINFSWALLLPALLLPQLRAVETFAERRVLRAILASILLWSASLIGIELIYLYELPLPGWLELLRDISIFMLAMSFLVIVNRYNASTLKASLHNPLVYRIIAALLLILTLNEFYLWLNSSNAGIEQIQLVRFGLQALLLGMLWIPVANGLQYLASHRLRHNLDQASELIERIIEEAMAYSKNSQVAQNLPRLISQPFKLDSIAIIIPRSNNGFHFHYLQPAANITRQEDMAHYLQAHPLPVNFSRQQFNQLLSPLQRMMGATHILPLVFKQQVLGAILLKAPLAQAFLPDQLLNELRHQLAEIIYINRLRYTARHDGLTGLLRREAIQESLQEDLLRHQRSGNALTVAMLDFDHFKRVNDQHGHAAGDVVLQQITRQLQQRLRQLDSIGRWGGEEFLLILPDTDCQEAWALLDNLRQNIAALSIEISAAESIQITVSIGLACYSTDSNRQPSPDISTACSDIIKQADQALYFAKQQGRNQVQIFHPQQENNENQSS